jgi:hypothetical protein
MNSVDQSEDVVGGTENITVARNLESDAVRSLKNGDWNGRKLLVRRRESYDMGKILRRIKITQN